MMTDRTRFMAALAGYIQHELAPDARTAVDADTPLFEGGLIDSLKILHLIAFVENATGQSIPEQQIVMKHFRTVRAIAETFIDG